SAGLRLPDDLRGRNGDALRDPESLLQGCLQLPAVHAAALAVPVASALFPRATAQQAAPGTGPRRRSRESALRPPCHLEPGHGPGRAAAAPLPAHLRMLCDR